MVSVLEHTRHDYSILDGIGGENTHKRRLDCGYGIFGYIPRDDGGIDAA
jgi:hypothetical protein